MLSLRGIRRVCILGGGTAGWLAALQLRRIFGTSTEIMVISAPEIPIIGVGEGAVLNFVENLHELDIPLIEFLKETGAVHKLGFAYEGWRDHHKNKNDNYYHMFPMTIDDIFGIEAGYKPVFSMLVNHGVPISYITDSIALREKNIAQDELTNMFIKQQNKTFASSFHFDTYKVGQYFRKIALKRGVLHKEGLFKDIEQHPETGYVTKILVDGQWIDVDFLIDASGFSRQILGKKLNAKWQSFQDYLPLNTAIPFHLKHTQKNPDLVTRSTALDAGWVWQIPLQERIGAGYVFNKDYITEEQAVREVEQWLGHTIDPIRTISFEAGFYQKIWHGNVLAIGLASGFVEPLEATSIAQTIMQIKMFVDTLLESNGMITQFAIDNFNQENTQSWHGIRDFIRMHYDTKRSDTPFWQSVADLSMSEHYLDLKECWLYRTPRTTDLKPYVMNGNVQFGLYSWLAIAQALGIVQGKATVTELMSLSADKQQKVIAYANQLRIKRGLS